jgi:hypothetical protein
VTGEEEKELELIPRSIRDKLDRVGIKLHLKDWQKLSLTDRRRLRDLPCDSRDDVARYAGLVANHPGDRCAAAAIEDWSVTMLSKADDYPIHQTCEPIAHIGTSDRNFYDRYFFNGYTPDGSTYFAAALGSYPNRQVMDAAFSVVRRGRQYVLRASRLAGTERMDTRVGPVGVEVIEPLARLRLTVEPNRFGISGDLLFTRRAPVLEEPRFLRRIDGRIFMDYTRLTQHGEWSGTLAVEGERIDVGALRFRGTRDRSWGIRPVGEREAGAPSFPLQFFWLWAPLHFDDLCTHFDVNEDAEGEQWHAAGMVIPSGGEVEHCRAVSHRLRMQPGTRHASGAEITLHRRSGAELRVALKPLYNFYMVGLGYGHPQWGHGMFVGENEVAGESWGLTEIDPSIPLHLHVQAVCEATLESPSAGPRRGIGVLEQLILGPHKPTGFKELFDMAPQ